MGYPSVNHAALRSPGQTSNTLVGSRFGASSPLDCLGEIKVAGELALVVWPQLGDAIAVDFECDGHRYAIVTGLNGDGPELKSQPLAGRPIGPEHEPAVLAAVCDIWARHRASA